MDNYDIHYVKNEYDEVLVHCPKCREKQILPIEEEWYEVDIYWHVEPVFVCMSESRKCDCMMSIKLKEWKG